METYENFYHDKYGYCYYAIAPGKTPIIFNLFIEPEYRKKGYAKHHLKIVIDEIRKTGYTGKIEIEAKPQENSVCRKTLIRVYEKLGLTVI